MTASHRAAGIALVLVSAVSFGAMALFARMAYADGMDPGSLLLLRFAIAAAVMLAISFARGEHMPRGRTLAGFALMGGLGYVGQSMCFFTALTMANAGLVALLLYLYPALVAVLSAVFLRERLGARRALAVAIALVGTALTVGPEPAGRPLGIVLGLGAAVIYSVYILVGTRLLSNSSPIASSAVIMSAAALVFAALGAVRGVTVPATATGWIGVIGVAVIATVIAITTFLIGLRLIGPTSASVLSTAEPVTTVVLAALVLGEPIGLLAAAGGIAILAGALLLAFEPNRETPRVPAPSP